MTGDRWHKTADLAGLPGMPRGERSIRLHGPKRGWVSRQAGRGLEWLETSLPETTQRALRPSVTPPAETPAEPEAPRRPASNSEMLTADARLAVVSAWQRWHHTTDLASVPSQQAFADLYRDGAVDVPDWVRREVPTLAWNTLQRWAVAHRKGGWSALVPRRGGQNRGTGTIDQDAEVRDLIVAHILDRPGHVNAKHIIRALRARFEADRVPAYRTLQRWIAGWLEANRLAVSAVADPDRHRSRTMPAAGDRSAGIERLNQVWELDSTPADVLCLDGRHAIVGCVDIYSRRLKVLVVPTSKSVAIAALLRRTLLDWGVPETVRTDEGSDYTSRHMRRVLADLGIAHDALPPFSPDQKPFIERGLGTLSRIFEMAPGFAGHSVAEAQSLRNRKSFAARRGESTAETFSVQMTAPELQALCDAWLDDVYGREPHSGLSGRSPFEVAAAWRQPVRRIENDRALDLLLAEPAEGGWRTIQKKGVAAEGTFFLAPELGALVGERVHVRLDPVDAGTVFLFDADGQFLCRAVAPERAGVDRQELARAMKDRWREAAGEARAYARHLKRRHKPENVIPEILAAARASADRVVAFPTPALPYSSDGLEAARAAAEADAPDMPAPDRTDSKAAERRRAQREALQAEQAEREAAEARQREERAARQARAKAAVQNIEKGAKRA